MEDWVSLPHIAREIDIPNSTARRWAATLDEFLISRGRGAGRRFHPDAREVLRRAKLLYGTGLGADQILEILRAEAPRSADEAGVADEAGASSVSAIAGEILALASLTAESAVPSTAESVSAPSIAPDVGVERLLQEFAALKQAIAKSAADQRRENARFRSVLGALVDLIEVQDQNRRLGMAEKEKRDTQAQQRIIAGLQELLRIQREDEEEAPEESSSRAGAKGRLGRRRFR